MLGPVPAHLPSYGSARYYKLDCVSSKEDFCSYEESDTSEFEAEQITNEGSTIPCSCTSTHEGRQILNVDLQMHVDKLFDLVFTKSQFYLNFHAERKSTDIVQTPWQVDPESGQKKKKVELTVSLSQAIGPKSSRVTENFVMLPCSHPGRLYSMDMAAYNSGFRYADAFYCFTHFCLYDTTKDHSLTKNNIDIDNFDPHSFQRQHSNNSSLPTCHFSVFSQLIYTKSIWSPVKSIIDKSSWLGIEEFYDSLISKLKLECDSVGPSIHEVIRKQKSGVRKRKKGVAGSGIAEAIRSKIDDGLASTIPARERHKRSGGSQITWILLFTALASFVLLNILLYYKLKTLESFTSKSNTLPTIDLGAFRYHPVPNEERLKLSLNPRNFHDLEMDSWINDLEKTLNLLQQVVDLLKKLARKIPMETRHMVTVASYYKNHHLPTENEKSTKS